MAVDLFELVETLRRAVNPPGTDVFPNAQDEEFAGYLSDAFWEIRMLSMFENFTESDGLIAPLQGTDDLPRELQQLIVLYAAINIVTNELKNVEQSFRAKGGPAEFETTKSPLVLRAVLDELQRRRAVVEEHLLGMGTVTDAYIDSVISRTDAQLHGTSWWVS
jgi:hypothetical protein